MANAVHWGVSFTLSNPADTRLLLEHSRKDLPDSEPTGTLAADLAAVNTPLIHAMHTLAARLYGTVSAATAYALASAARALVSDARVPTRARTSRQRKQGRDT